MKGKWLVIENTALLVAFCFLVVALDGWEKVWALVPILFVNYVATEKAENK